jgi:hypothetical protein
MASFCLFGGYEGQLSGQRSAHVTVFGGSHLYRPPAARLVVQRRHAGADLSAGAVCTCFTLFGSVEICWATLAAEFIALREALQNNTLTLADWDAFIAREGSGMMRVDAISIFGGAEVDAVPKDEKELDELSLQRHLGHIPNDAVDRLLPAVGTRDILRLEAVRSAVVATLPERS